MAFTKNDLENFLVKKAKEYWEKDQQPYFLAMVEPDLNKEDKSYKDILGEQKISKYAEELTSLKFVRHPQKYAMVAVVPKDAEFEFVDEPAEPNFLRDGSRRNDKRSDALADFVAVLSRLDDSTLSQFMVPGSVLVKLAKKK